MRRVRVVGIGLLALAALLPGAQAAKPARGASFTVNSTVDAVDAAPGDGVCADGSGQCTLRAAVQEANALPDADAITLPAGLYRLTIAEYGFGAEPSANGDLDVTDDLTIAGDGAWTTEIDQRAEQARILETAEDSVVAISGLTIRGGNTIGYPGAPDASGGGILNAGTLTLDGVAVTGNSAGRSARGGGIYSTGPLTVMNSTVSGNYAVFDGTGIDAGSVTVINSTISGNYTEFGGAGVWAGAATLRNATVAENEDLNLFVGAATLTVVNTIIAAAPDEQNCYLSGYGAGPVVSLGHNIDSDGSCGLSGPGDLSGVDPMLGELADNGGPTLTHALLPGSPAIDAGDDARCPAADQRGAPRPGGANCDIGAYEAGSEAPPPPELVQGDADCDGAVTAFDALKTLQFVAGLSFTQGPDCPKFGDPTVLVAIFGDVNCDGAVDAVDALQILRFLAALPVNQNEGCTEIGKGAMSTDINLLDLVSIAFVTAPMLGGVWMYNGPPCPW